MSFICTNIAIIPAIFCNITFTWFRRCHHRRRWTFERRRVVHSLVHGRGFVQIVDFVNGTLTQCSSIETNLKYIDTIDYCYVDNTYLTHFLLDISPATTEDNEIQSDVIFDNKHILFSYRESADN